MEKFFRNSAKMPDFLQWIYWYRERDRGYIKYLYILIFRNFLKDSALCSFNPKP